MVENGGSAKQGSRAQVQADNRTKVRRPMYCKVLLLSGEEFEVSIDKRAVGQVLFENVCDYLDLLERDYFGLQFTESHNNDKIKYWLDLNKKVAKQKSGKMVFEFGVKFYPPDPMQLSESLTRYLVTLQIRRDIISGRLPCSHATQAMLGSYAVQADVGDYDPVDHGAGIDYIRSIPFAPEQTDELLQKIATLHKQHKGQTPEQAELHYLEYSKKIPLYGIDLHRAKDSDYMNIFLGVGATGISVYRDSLRINRFVWPKILKISYRKNKFLLRIRPAEFDTFESWIVFRLPSNKEAKRLWKISVEHHSFLRLRSAEDAKKRSGFPRFGSKYRYSGRTLYQTRLNASMADRPSKQFERTHSRQSLDSILKPRSRSQENLYDPVESYNGQRIKNVQNLSLNIKKAQTNRASMEDGRTPFQSPPPVIEQPKFNSHQINRHNEREEEEFYDDGHLPDVPEESPRSDRKSPVSNHHSVANPHVVVATKTPDSNSESDRSYRGSLDSVDLREEEDKKQNISQTEVKTSKGKQSPPVAKKPSIFKRLSKSEKSSKTEKSFKVEKNSKIEKSSKSEKPSKALKPSKKEKEKEAAKEVFM